MNGGYAGLSWVTWALIVLVIAVIIIAGVLLMNGPNGG